MMVDTLRDFFRDETIPADHLIGLIKDNCAVGEERVAKSSFEPQFID